MIKSMMIVCYPFLEIINDDRDEISYMPMAGRLSNHISSALIL